MSTYFKKGSWNAVCDVCGFVFKSHELKQRWDGMRVCKEDWEPRHPSDFQRVKGEKSPPPWTSPDDTEGTETLITKAAAETYATTDTRYSIWIKSTGANAKIVFPQLDDATALTEYPTSIGRRYRIYSDADSTDNITLQSSGTSVFVGSTTLIADQTIIVEGIPGQNIWLRK